MFNVRVIAASVLLLTPAFLGCSEKPREINKGENTGVLTTTAKAEVRPVERHIKFAGELQAEEEAIVKAEVKGRIDAAYKNLGEAVKTGDVIVRLDPEEYRISGEQAAQAFKEAQSKYELARLNWERADSLFNKGLISQRERDEAKESLKGFEALVRERQAALELAAKRLRDTEIVAPFPGVIKEKFVNPGDHVDDRTAIASVVALSPLKLRASIPEKAAGIIRNGLRVVLRVEAYPNKVFEGSVIRVSPSLDPKTRTLLIEAAFPNRDGLLKPGFFAEGKVVTNRGDRAVVVPEEALVSFAGVKKVFVIENGTASERVVKVGERIENMIEIAEGIGKGEVVATSALNKLSTGVTVEIKR